MASNACFDESLEINGLWFIQMTGNFSIKDIFQKNTFLRQQNVICYSAWFRKACSLSEGNTVKNLQVLLSLSFAILFLVSETWRSPR